MAKKPLSENWPIVDWKEIAAKAKQVADAAKELSEFEADFLKEIIRMAMKFQKTFRMTAKQSEMLEQLYIKYCMAAVIDAKTKKKKENVTQAKGTTSRSKSGPRKTKPKPRQRKE